MITFSKLYASSFKYYMLVLGWKTLYRIQKWYINFDFNVHRGSRSIKSILLNLIVDVNTHIQVVATTIVRKWFAAHIYGICHNKLCIDFLSNKATASMIEWQVFACSSWCIYRWSHWFWCACLILTFGDKWWAYLYWSVGSNERQHDVISRTIGRSQQCPTPEIHTNIFWIKNKL